MFLLRFLRIIQAISRRNKEKRCSIRKGALITRTIRRLNLRTSSRKSTGIQSQNHVKSFNFCRIFCSSVFFFLFAIKTIFSYTYTQVPMLSHLERPKLVNADKQHLPQWKSEYFLILFYIRTFAGACRWTSETTCLSRLEVTVHNLPITSVSVA